MANIVITNNQNILPGIAQNIAMADPSKDLTLSDRLRNSLKAFSDVQLGIANDYSSGGALAYGLVDSQTYRVTLDSYDIWYKGSFSSLDLK